MLDDVSIWTALADPKRRQIINLLEERPRTTSDLSQYFDVSRFAVMKHLKVLEQANLITAKREGRTRWNFINEDLAHFLRTKLADEEGPNRLVDILGLFPGKRPVQAAEELWPTPIRVEQRLLMQATPAEVFAAFTAGIDFWWSQRTAPESKMVLETVVNGRFYEAFDAANQGVLLASVTAIKKDERLHLQGTAEFTELLVGKALADNQVRIKFEAQQGDTLLFLCHTSSEVGDEGATESLRLCWRQLLDHHFQPFVEKGLPYQHYP